MSLAVLSAEVETLFPECIDVLQRVRVIARNPEATPVARYMAITALVGEIYAELPLMPFSHDAAPGLAGRVPEELVESVTSAVRIVAAISRHRDRSDRDAALDEIHAAVMRAFEAA